MTFEKKKKSFGVCKLPSNSEKTNGFNFLILFNFFYLIKGFRLSQI